MDVVDFLKGAAWILGMVVVVDSAVVFLVNFFIPGSRVMFSLGYSMCGEHSPQFDFLTLKQTDCSIVPGDALVVVRSWPPKIGDVACVATNIGVICHRVVEKRDGYYVMEGDAAKWKLPFTKESYVGKVVMKIPRFFALPLLEFRAVLNGKIDAIRNIDAGSYNPF